jgi:predicted  nucleic acid-binding Zn-ribbon protein
VKEDLKLLVDLQGIDALILQKKDIIEAIPRKVSSVEQPLKNAQAVHGKSKQKLDVLAKKKREKEQLLEDTSERIKKLRARMSEIKTNKEYQAHLKEIEAAEKEGRAVEDEILSLMEALDAVQQEVKGLEAGIRTEEEKINAFRKKLQGDAAGMQKEIEELALRKKEIVKALDRELYVLYVQLFETKKGLAVVETRGEVCQGCNMNIPPQLFVEIKKSEKIIQCPQCTRILYWNAEKSPEQ